MDIYIPRWPGHFARSPRPPPTVQVRQAPRTAGCHAPILGDAQSWAENWAMGPVSPTLHRGPLVKEVGGSEAQSTKIFYLEHPSKLCIISLISLICCYHCTTIVLTITIIHYWILILNDDVLLVRHMTQEFGHLLKGFRSLSSPADLHQVKQLRCKTGVNLGTGGYHAVLVNWDLLRSIVKSYELQHHKPDTKWERQLEKNCVELFKPSERSWLWPQKSEICIPRTPCRSPSMGNASDPHGFASSRVSKKNGIRKTQLKNGSRVTEKNKNLNHRLSKPSVVL